MFHIILFFFWRATSLEQLYFQKTLSSIAATFSEDLLFHNILFLEELLFRS